MISGIGTWRSGVPYTAGIQFTGAGGESANSLNGLNQQSGNIPVFVDGDGNVIDLLQANNFSRAQLVSFLSGAKLQDRNSERQPSVWDVDLRLSKMFGLGRGMNLELIGEVFNALNRRTVS